MQRERIHRTIYLLLLAMLGCSMVSSVWLANLSWVLLVANWVAEGRWREKWQMARQSRLLHAWVGLYLLLGIGLLWTSNMAHGLDVMRGKLSMLAVPAVMLTTRPLSGRERLLVGWIYAAAVLAVSVVSAVRLLTIADLPYREAVPHVSHIRFALNCCMVIYLCVATLLRGRSAWRWMALPLMLWMLLVLLMLRSYTAVAVLAVVSLCVVLVFYRRWPLVAAWMAAALAVGGLVGYYAYTYYHLLPQAVAPRESATANGRPYTHAEDGIVENGNYVNNYVCTDELRREWNKRSAMDYDSCVPTGYSVESTLVRYLNGMGLTKDSVGVAAMSADDVSAVECGVANPVYEEGNVVKKMVYVMLLEREYHRHTNAVVGFTMLQRFEMWRTACRVVAEHLLLGVGTGDADDELHAALSAVSSDLAQSSKRSHNQYLSLAVAIGLLGLGAAVALFVRAAWRRRPSPLMAAWAITILVSCLTEDTLDTLAGILFCSYFLSFREQQCTNTTP